MDNRLIQSAKQLNKRRRRRRAWTRGLLILSCVVALGTIYVMSLPAITQEKDTFCGSKAHEHTVECFTKLKVETTSELICTLQEKEPHVHTDACYEFGTNHEHVDACYEISEGHVHGDDCYEIIDGHTHGDNCYEIIDGHIHGDGCYEVTDGHMHGEACYEVTGGHTHGDACYTMLGGHVHGDGCYTTIAGHTHGADCYDEENQLVCTRAGAEESRRISCETPESAGESVLICAIEETEGCRTLSCTQEEAAGELTLSCEKVEGEEEKILVCTQEEAGEQRVLICTEPETEAEKIQVCTEEKTLVCTLAEQERHTHGEECFHETEEDILTCTLEESEEHKHMELCYGQWELTCQKEEHTHTLICYSNPKADVEKASQWEKTFRDVKITGLHREDVLAIARTQLGYRESSRNYIVKEDGKTTDGYTRYGDWYGDTYGEWCAMFVSFCLEYAEVPDVPHHAACQAWIDVLDDLDMYVDAENQKPLPGYLIFFDWNGDGYSDHVGLVEDIKEDGTVVTIEGNNGKKVTLAEYEENDLRVMGYGIVPEGELRAEETEPMESEMPTDREVPIESEVPTEGEAPTESEVPTEGETPTESEAPTEGEAPTDREVPTESEAPTEGETPTEEVTESVDWTMLRKIPVYLNNKREELVTDADEVYVTGDLPDGASVYAVPAAVETDGEILSAYQISILLPDFTAYYPTPEDNLQITVKSPEFEDEYLQIRSCPAEGEHRVIPGTTDGQSISFFLDTTDPFVIVKMPAPIIQQTIRAVIYTDETFQQLAEDETAILITGLLPEGAAARAYAVVLQEDLIEGQTVLLAYDITIVDRDGNPIEQESSGNPFRVSIQPPGWEPSDDENYNIYYVPEDGDPEMMDSESQEDAVSFTTDHFSTYVLTATGTNSTIYLNGDSGNDSRAGTSTSTAVKTLEKALTLVKEGGTIYITGTVTVSDTQEWDLGSSVTIKRYSSFTGPLVTVSNSGSLTLKNITIHGGSGTPSSSNIATNTTYASGSAKAPLIVVSGNGNLVINDGAVLTNNSNKPDTSRNQFVENGYVGQGGAIYCEGTLTMNGGTVRYCEAESGGGIYIENGTFNLNGGLIDSNYARDIVSTTYRASPFHKNAGGGVYVGDYSTMNMTGGTISNNQSSREGGGISLGWLNRNDGAAINEFITTFNMTGGTITGNLAISTGGGLNITAGRQAFISAGTFTNNTANGLEYQPSDGSGTSNVYSGGAIYLDAQQTDSRGNYAGKPGYAVINRVLITGNTATNYGGGIACCSTSVTSVNSSVVLNNGTAIYNNNGGTGEDMYIVGTISGISDTVLGGGKYNWKKGTNTYDNDLTDNSSAIKTAKELATVIITGNTGRNGGGIGCNGEIEIGGESDTESITITKIWNDDGTVPHPDFITVQIYQNGKPYGDPITIYPSVDANGKEVWPIFYVDGLPEGYTYTVKEIEIPGFDSEVSVNGNNFTITNTPTGFSVVKKWVGDTESDRPDSIRVQLFQNGVAYGDIVTLTPANNWKYSWLDLPEGFTYTVKEIEVPDGYYITGDGELLDADTWQITNTLSPLTSISVEKRWEGGDPLESVAIYLLSNGVQIDEATLSAANGWFYKWDGLPVYGKLGTELEYTVKEANVRGFASSVKQADSSDALRAWNQVDNLASGKTYLLVSSGKALVVDANGLNWADVPDVLSSGGAADSSLLWTYNGSLQNGNGKYLYGKSSGSLFNYTYSFEAATSSSNITWDNGYLKASFSAFLSSTTRYVGTVSSGTATAVSGTSEATKFTAYELTTNEGSWGENHYIVTNTKLPDSIEFRFAKYAVGSKEPTLLAGAQLELYKVSTEGVTIPGTNQTGTLVRSWTSENGASADSGIHIEDLFSGTYYLIETHTPAGHVGLSGPVIFEVDAENGQVQVIESPYELTLVANPEVDFPVYNNVAYELPDTGGTGTVMYIVGGLLLTILAMVLLLYNNKCRKEEKPSF